ncbi:putative lipopolysaccharide core biosynthesis mannosyltransferaseprotein [Halalkalibacter wakoensis JCM 9140]|uniref:Putative lipopolysaccharide core biosynthesis mannosyltransferaseprotein n=1 Tax=Halalkalibacter wakoensis JCM 9140 TaxID=1236970 RepID=W4Q4S1_9BACI|nr:glycosyltransferase family 4 protein [Halalkalibacter wakoensis]GAE26930.1 putative lipopolysaccharide core biosynthesis mannosyltransferaseprotein [Halalkalibacter wakoensis JCM 9140]
MKVLVIWRLLTVGGVNAGWRNRAVYFKQYGIDTEFLYTKDLGGLHIMKDISKVYLTKNKEEIVQIIKHNHYDAIIVVDTKDAYQWIKEADFKGPVIVEACTPEIIKLKPHLENFCGIKPEVIIVPSQHQKRLVSILIDHIPIEVIHNGIHTSFFEPINVSNDSEPILPANKKIIGWIGRVDKRKNWRLLLRIAQLIKNDRNDVQFWLIGGAKSVQREKFIAEWKAQNLTDIITWYPVIPYQNMPYIYSKIRLSGGCTLATTKGESFGNTFIESMACGVPVVAPNISSIPEIVQHESNGLMYMENQEKDAVKAIYQILDEPTHYHSMSEAARENVLNHFSISTCADQYIHLLTTVINGGFKNAYTRRI